MENNDIPNLERRVDQQEEELAVLRDRLRDLENLHLDHAEKQASKALNIACKNREAIYNGALAIGVAVIFIIALIRSAESDRQGFYKGVLDAGLTGVTSAVGLAIVAKNRKGGAND